MPHRGERKMNIANRTSNAVQTTCTAIAPSVGCEKKNQAPPERIQMAAVRAVRLEKE